MKKLAVLFLVLMLVGCGVTKRETSGGSSGGGSNPDPVIPTPSTQEQQTTINYTDTGTSIVVSSSYVTTEEVVVKEIVYGGVEEQRRVVLFVKDRWNSSPFIVMTKDKTITCNETPSAIFSNVTMNIYENTNAPVAEDLLYVYKLRVNNQLTKDVGNYLKIYQGSVSTSNLIFYRKLDEL